MKKKKPANIRRIKGGITAARGFAAGGVASGIKKNNKPDLGLCASTAPCAAAGTFTRNRVRAACVEWNERTLPSGTVRAIICNSGNANACTGTQGEKDTREMARTTGRLFGAPATGVLVASTGVIGRFLPVEKITGVLPALSKRLAGTRAAGQDFAGAIMTTDTRLKETAARVTTPSGSYTVGGCAKGSGMIHPDMATMLAFITTDAACSPEALQAILGRCVDRTFNNLSVDGDTSTNDMALALANGVSGVNADTAEGRPAFEEALFIVCDNLCACIAADGEGATKRIEIRVRGGAGYADAKRAAKAIANSNLVKTAIFGNDPNWGRLLCAVGYSGARFSKNKIEVRIGAIPVCRALRPVAFAAGPMQKALRGKVVHIDVDLGMGNAEAVAHTCDLTYDYIKINAEYTT